MIFISPMPKWENHNPTNGMMARVVKLAQRNLAQHKCYLWSSLSSHHGGGEGGGSWHHLDAWWWALLSSTLVVVIISVSLPSLRVAVVVKVAAGIIGGGGDNCCHHWWEWLWLMFVRWRCERACRLSISRCVKHTCKHLLMNQPDVAEMPQCSHYEHVRDTTWLKPKSWL